MEHSMFLKRYRIFGTILKLNCVGFLKFNHDDHKENSVPKRSDCLNLAYTHISYAGDRKIYLYHYVRPQGKWGGLYNVRIFSLQVWKHFAGLMVNSVILILQFGQLLTNMYFTVSFWEFKLTDLRILSPYFLKELGSHYYKYEHYILNVQHARTVRKHDFDSICWCTVENFDKIKKNHWPMNFRSHSVNVTKLRTNFSRVGSSVLTAVVYMWVSHCALAY